ncbi:DUF4380 domain-containing protein [Polyangium sorediatum]|uniref:DUF4380 domain-containing protein n=1 Tax=Polyangium sorediatum TaxID=889274 RepID=A0ABT6NK91_9BACT|nr:DUF4380 domain-containing protein [Polyangium sorediatum]MDI1428660.1 DUF4380 domain-containing protein [Polyangium sorediatum]
MNHLPASATLLMLTLLFGCSAKSPDDTTGGGGASATSSSSATGGASTGGSSSGGEGGGGAGPVEMLDGPIERDGVLVLEFSSLYFEVDPSKGARISALRWDGIELLTDAAVNAVNWGSTFWTSPQSDWGWPPPAAVDSSTYTPTIDESSFRLAGPQASYAGKTLSIEKAFAADFSREAVVVTYTIRNTGNAPFSVAPWEVTRVAQGGLTFFPTGDTQFTPGGSNPLPVESAESVTWFDGAAHPPDGQQKKLNADGKEGWVAHVAGDLLFLKRFADVPSSTQAPGEGEVEIFAQSAAEGGYVEVENQGRYAEIAPGASATYEVTWLVRKLPAGATAQVGSAALLDFVRSLP